MILQRGEKIHAIHRPRFDKDPHRHFVGVVDEYENGVARATGYVYVVDRTKLMFVKRKDKRTRLVAIGSGDVLVNILPASVELEKISYKHEQDVVRVTDGSDWHLDITEYSWL